MKLFSTFSHSASLAAQPNWAVANHPFPVFAVKAVFKFINKNAEFGAVFARYKRPRAFVAVLLSFLCSFVQAQITSTATGGNWNSSTTWLGGVVPVSGNTVTIVGGASVNVDVTTATCASLNLGNSNNSTALLSFNNNAILKVTGGVVVGSNGQRRGSINMTNGGTLKIGGGFTAPNLDVYTRGTGTIEYDGSGVQTVLAAPLVTYHNLKLSGSGAKSIISGTSIEGNLSIAGATASIGTGLNISVGSLTFGAINQVNGTWGSTASAAVNKNDTYFAVTTGIITVNIDGRPVFTGLTIPPSIIYGTSTVTLSGTLSSFGPTYPANGETVNVTINGVAQNATISGGLGGFSINFPTSSLNVVGSPYTIQYSYAGGANLLAAVNNSSTSLVVTPASLVITANDISKDYNTRYRFSGSEFKAVGLVNGNIISSVTLSSTGAIASAPVSGNPYPILISGAAGTSFVSSNYSITYINGNLTVIGISQSIADYRSKASGNFSSASIWEYEQGGNSWGNATLPPTSGSNITILHDIALDQNHTAGANKIFLISTGGILSINPGITLGVALNGTLNFNARPVVVKSTVAGTGSIGKILGTLIGETNVTAERYIGGSKRAWRLLTIPVTGNTIREAWAGVAANPAAPAGELAGAGTLITGHNYTDGSTAAAAGFDWFSGLGSTTTSSIRFYTQAAAWASASNTANPNLAPSKEGYLLYVRGDRTVASSGGAGNTTLRPFGTLQKGEQIIPVSESFTVIGNPYASAINLDSIYNNSGNSSVINRNFWVWDASLGTSGGYRTLSWNGVDYNMTGGNGSANDYLVVNSGQAFLVQPLSNGTITINENNKTSAVAPQLLRPVGITGAGVSNLNISLYQATGNILGSQTDRVIARYNDIYKESPFESFDAAKLNNFNENLSLVRDNKYLSIESRPFPTRNDTLYLPFWNLTQNSYAFEITSSKFIGVNQTARLIDAFTKTETFLEMNDGTIVYPFTVSSDPASSSLNRFTIIMAPATVLAVSCTKFNASLIGNKVDIIWSTSCEVGATDFVIEKSADGVRFSQFATVAAKNIATGANYQVFDLQPFNGKNFYRIRSNDKAGHFTYTSIALIQLNGKKDIQVIPTIIDNKHFTLTFNHQALGKYNVSLSNVSGQQVFQTTVSNTGVISTHQIDLSNGVLPKGIYHLSVTNEQGTKQNIQLLINN